MARNRMARANSWPLPDLPISPISPISIVAWLLLLLLCGPASASAQGSQAAALHVTGDVPTHLDLSVAEIAAFPRQTLKVTDEKGHRAEYEGVPVAEILEKAGAPLGTELKGPNMATGLIAAAPDGYRVL